MKTTGAWWWCDSSLVQGPNWSYDVRYGECWVEVLGAQPPPDPPETGLTVRFGEGRGRPGEEVRVPVWVSGSQELEGVILCLEMDPRALQGIAFVAPAVDGWTGEPKEARVERGEERFFRNCRDEGGFECAWDDPAGLKYWDTAEKWALIDLMPLANRPEPFPGAEEHVVGWFLLRVREDVTVREAALVAGKATYVDEQGFEAVLETGGYVREAPEEPGRFGPAQEVIAGRFIVELPQARRMVRGDSNGDRDVNLTDAVSTLMYLFAGSGDPFCLEAADADDSGRVEITDAVFTLGALFLGVGAIPPPYPDCGDTSGLEDLGCVRSACDQEE